MSPAWIATIALGALAGWFAWSADATRGRLELCELRQETAVAQGIAAGLREAVKKADKIAEQARIDHAELARYFETAAARADGLASTLRGSLRELPRPGCGPGQARVDAWNEVLR